MVGMKIVDEEDGGFLRRSHHMRQSQVGIVIRGELKVDATAEEFDFSWCLSRGNHLAMKGRDQGVGGDFCWPVIP